MKAYRILKADGKSTLAIKEGFCWPAFFFGVLWALYKGFWPALAILLVLNVGLNKVLNLALDNGSAVLGLASFCLLLTFKFVFGKYANVLLTAYKRSKGYVQTQIVTAQNVEGALVQADARTTEAMLEDWKSLAHSDIGRP